MSEHKIPIPSMIYNAAVGGHVTNSQQIIDESLNREQNDINQETVGAVLYNSTTPNGMGRIVLKKNDNFKQVVEAQTDGNTIFVIKYDFTLTGDVTVPENCVLEFDGGSIYGEHTITGNNTIIHGEKCFKTTVILSGTYNGDLTPEMFGECGTSDDSSILNYAIKQAINISSNLQCINTYNIDNTLNIDRPVDGIDFVFRIYGGGIFNISSDVILFSSSLTGTQAISQYINFENLTFNGQETSFVASEKLLRISFISCFFNCKCVNSTYYIQSWYFSNCVIRKTVGSNQIWLKAANAYDISIDNCQADKTINNFMSFIDITDAYKISITNTLVEGFKGNAIVLNTSYCCINNCYFEGNVGYDIYITNSVVSLNGNYFFGANNDEYAIYCAASSSNITSFGNYFYQTYAYYIESKRTKLITEDSCTMQGPLVLCNIESYQCKQYFGIINDDYTMDVGQITSYALNIAKGSVIKNINDGKILYAICISSGTYSTATWNYINNKDYLEIYGNNDDLNTYQSPGRYIPSDNVNWETITLNLQNAPTTKCGVIDVDYYLGIIIQTFTEVTLLNNTEPCKKYIRRYYRYGGGWSPWKEITNI